MARHADIVSPMMGMSEAKPKIEAYAREFGRDPSRLKWEGGGLLFLHDDPLVIERVLRFAMEQYSQTEDQVRNDGFFGSVDDVGAAVQRQVDDGADSINLFQLPRVHSQSLLRFSDEVIPYFR